LPSSWPAKKGTALLTIGRADDMEAAGSKQGSSVSESSRQKSHPMAFFRP
jgi:hypothetical protein